MDQSLQKYTIPDDVKAEILRSLWKECQPSIDQTVDLEAYFEDYYRTRVQQFSREGGTYICISSHADIFKVTKQIVQDATRDTLSDFVSKLTQSHHEKETISPKPTTDAMNSTVDFCAGLLLMCEFDVPQFGFSGSNPLPWSPELTLRQAAALYFSPQHTKTLQPDNPRIPRIFAAKSLVSIGGMRIRWTNNLVDHLLLSDDDETALVFPQVGFLRHHASFRRGHLPDGLASETLRPLALLFPTADMDHTASRKKWLDTQGNMSLTKLGTPRASDRRFERFIYWHDRLVILKQAFDEASPRGWRQWWNDRRNSVQWYTFWVAVWVYVTAVVFGIVQSVEGGLQVYLAWTGAAKGVGG
ncbi:hypothetical protein V8F06_014510 [Rhypophila decipiens]